MTEQRQSTPIDKIAEAWVETLVELNPTIGTYIGRTSADGKLADLSPSGHDRKVEETKRVLAELTAAPIVDEVDRITKTDLTAELELSLEQDAAELQLRDLNVIASPAQEIRESFDLMAKDSPEQWENIAHRLAAVPSAIDGYIATLKLGIERGVVPAARQVREVAHQVRRYVGAEGFFAELVSGTANKLAESQQRDLDRGAGKASQAYSRLADFLESELAQHAGVADGVGRDIYTLQSRSFLGAVIDLDETYEWGVAELNRMIAEQEATANEISAGATVPEAIAELEADPVRKLYGTEALQRWMQEASDKAVAELSRSHFKIPDQIKTLECMIAPTNEGGIYYTGPTDDFARPGRMWWSVPEGVTEFDTWRELTTVYHEGVPGHHLQIGQAVVNRGQLNLWRRQLAGTSGHAEGWALYAERLMQELGYLDDPGDRMGMLDGQRLRAARVVLDIGVHLGKQRPDGNGVWTGDYAFEFLAENVAMNEGFIKFEANRYLGWPGQAPSYKVGQRIWEQLRDAVRKREGSSFDIRAFHERALNLGGVRLGTLKSALLN